MKKYIAMHAPGALRPVNRRRRAPLSGTGDRLAVALLRNERVVGIYATATKVCVVVFDNELREIHLPLDRLPKSLVRLHAAKHALDEFFRAELEAITIRL